MLLSAYDTLEQCSHAEVGAYFGYCVATVRLLSLVLFSNSSLLEYYGALASEFFRVGACKLVVPTDFSSVIVLLSKGECESGALGSGGSLVISDRPCVKHLSSAVC